ncbi:hypothetical protein GGR50DRAFT_487804 [Xylaria sp. CBS 124048]|nr:hypothetical protein GGR50DRAFT_487804 [Xylaria sp. CBS 124048]
MATAVKRACDACHRRKVKCDGINPCRNCSSAQLTCTYNAIPQKKGPKGSRAKVISELRETQRQTSLSAQVQSRLNGLGSPQCSSPSLAPTPGLLGPELVKYAIEFFFNNMYSIMPILHRQRLEQERIYMEQDPTIYCLLASLSSFMLFQPGMSLPPGDPREHMPAAHISTGTLLMEEAIRVRRGFDYLESPGLNSLCTSYFLFCSHYALEMHERAWFYLREATTLAHLCGMTREESYLHDNVESSRRRRLYWLLFVTERAYALQRGRPLTLQASINLPSMSDDPSDPLAHQLNSYLSLVSMFRPFDDSLISPWNKLRGDFSTAYLATLRKEIPGNSRMSGLMSEQENDQRLIRQWLKTVIWQMNMQNGCTPQNGQEQMHYQMDMSREIMSMVSQLRTETTELLGVSLVAKLLNVACTLVDFLAAQPPHTDPFTMGPRGHLQSLLEILSSIRDGAHHHLPLLLDKIHEVLPRLATPMLQRAPDTACIPNISNIEIFDGFGNAGMAQSPIMTDFKTEPYASNGIPHLQDIPAMESSSSNSGSDMKSPFSMAASPSVMSPTMEYPRGGDFNSIPEMLMSPIGHPQQPSLGQPGNHQHQHQHPHPHQIHNMVPQNINQSHHLNNSMSIDMHNNIPNGLNQNTNFVGMGQSQSLPQNQPYNQTNQSMINNNVMHRTPPQRANSFVLHQHHHQQQHHQPAHIPRTVGDFHALQRANSENVTMNSMGLRHMQPELDFSNLP